jgi:hypothetical protein
MSKTKKTPLADSYVYMPTEQAKQLLQYREAYKAQRAELNPPPLQEATLPQPKTTNPLHRINWREPLMWLALCLLSVAYGITRALRHY